MKRTALWMAMLVLAVTLPGRADLGEKKWDGPPPVEVVTFTARTVYSAAPGEAPNTVNGQVALRNPLDKNLEKVRFEIRLVDGAGQSFTACSQSLPTEQILGGGEASLRAGRTWSGPWSWDNVGQVNLGVGGTRIVVTGLVPLEGHTSGFDDGKVAKFRVEAGTTD